VRSCVLGDASAFLKDGRGSRPRPSHFARKASGPRRTVIFVRQTLSREYRHWLERIRCKFKIGSVEEVFRATQSGTVIGTLVTGIRRQAPGGTVAPARFTADAGMVCNSPDGCADPEMLPMAKTLQAGVRHFLRSERFQTSTGQWHSQSWLCTAPPLQKAHKSVPVPQNLQNSATLHFVGTASKLFVLLTSKGLTLGC
jgi:hypothetical protein